MHKVCRRSAGSGAAMTRRVHAARDGDIATVTRDHPAKLNTLTVAMWRELARTMCALSAEEALRCVILRGAGERALAAGADVAEFAAVRDNAEQRKVYHREIVHRALDAIALCRLRPWR